ncbi:TPA: RNA methyltransferase [Candidatus Nomurabacteria bacterium]|nr:RNA methyltransferase [Candidatus Nomurabacteria bacterium]
MKIAVIDNLRSVYNVGSIFRTANAVGIEKIILCGTTPTPLDKYGDKRSDFAKVALGAEDVVVWEYKEDIRSTIEELKDENYYIIAIEQDERSVDYKSVEPGERNSIAFIIGPEVDGMTKENLALCDVIAEIPMLGTKESLNVTIAFGIAVYRILGI